MKLGLKGVAKGGGIGGTHPTPTLIYIHSKKDCEKKKVLNNEEKLHKNIKDYK